jgi:hypothetical protein
MKRHLSDFLAVVAVLFLVLFMATIAQAAPFLVCDPQAGVTSYKLTGPAWLPVTAPAQPDGSIHLDLTGATVGSSSITLRACIIDPVWGEACSAATPFTFTRPATPVTSTGVKLAP